MTQLSVCIGSACHLKGAYNVISTFQHMIEELGLHDRVEFSAAFCRRECQIRGVGVSLDGVTHHIAAEDARLFFQTTVLERIQEAERKDA